MTEQNNIQKKDFSHLHCHTVYSVQDAIPNHKNYVDAIYKYNTDPNSRYNCIGFAATDHGNIYGMVKHYNACLNPDDKNRVIKPIFGCEVYHCEDRTLEDWSAPNRFHLVLIPTTQDGLENFYNIVSDGGLNPFEGKTKNFPICDIEHMKGKGKGIVALTACIGGIIPKAILAGDTDKAYRMLDTLKSIFDEVYLEVQPHEIPEQLFVNAELVEMSKKTGTKLVMTSDSHYIEDDDVKFHNVLKMMSHQQPFNMVAKLYTPEEMEEYCIKNNIPLECITNTAIIANACNVDPKPKDHRGLLPEFPCPDGYTPDTYLRKLCIEKMIEKIKSGKIDEDVPKHFAVLFYELDVISGQGFSSYFLILWDWFLYCRNNKILTGPGRGSAAGSIISYLLDITKVNPIKNGFIFERFMSPYRVEFPDIDTDIPTSKREIAIRYLEVKYGRAFVSQIVTFGRYKLKNTAKAILSAEGCDFTTANEITKGIPNLVDGNKEVTYDLIEEIAKDPTDPKFANYSKQEVDSLLKAYDKLQECFKMYPKVYDGIQHLNGCINSVGVHAGGVIVSKLPISNNAAVIINKGGAYLPVIQFEMSDLDFFGFLKIDALGLKALDIIQVAMDLIGLDYDWYDSEDYSDQNIYNMLKSGETTDVFQFSTPMPTKMLRDFDCKNLLDLSAVNAGNRPGPLEKDAVTGKSMVDLYADRTLTGIIPSINERIDYILAGTKGVLLFQEQCIFIGQEMAGYNLGNADLRIRKTLCKKLGKKIPEIRNEFVYGKKSLFDEDHNVIGISEEPSPYCEGAIARGFTEEEAQKMFDNMENFAKYA